MIYEISLGFQRSVKDNIRWARHLSPMWFVIIPTLWKTSRLVELCLKIFTQLLTVLKFIKSCSKQFSKTVLIVWLNFPSGHFIYIYIYIYIYIHIHIYIYIYIYIYVYIYIYIYIYIYRGGLKMETKFYIGIVLLKNQYPNIKYCH